MDISGILDNPLIKTLLLKKLDKAWKENGLTLVTITKDANGEFVIDTFTDEMKIITKTELLNIINS